MLTRTPSRPSSDPLAPKGCGGSCAPVQHRERSCQHTRLLDTRCSARSCQCASGPPDWRVCAPQPGVHTGRHAQEQRTDRRETSQCAKQNISPLSASEQRNSSSRVSITGLFKIKHLFLQCRQSTMEVFQVFPFQGVKHISRNSPKISYCENCSYFCWSTFLVKKGYLLF